MQLRYFNSEFLNGALSLTVPWLTIPAPSDAAAELQVFPGTSYGQAFSVPKCDTTEVSGVTVCSLCVCHSSSPAGTHV